MDFLLLFGNYIYLIKIKVLTPPAIATSTSILKQTNRNHTLSFKTILIYVDIQTTACVNLTSGKRAKQNEHMMGQTIITNF